MKKSGPLNSLIARAMSDLRHTDTLCIADCGLPCPPAVESIDISLKLGTPSFIETLQTIAPDIGLERVILAEEIKIQNPLVLAQIQSLLPGTPIEFIPHTQFKRQTQTCRAMIRTGEASPYANIILQAACIF